MCPTEPEVPAVGSDDQEPGHDDTGLDLARSLARSMRAAGRLRPKTGQRSARRRAVNPELSGAHPDGRDPARLGSVVDRLVSDSGWGGDVAVRGVFARWATIVGADVAAHCTPLGFEEGRLTVQTDSTAWATQLRLLAPTLVRRLNEELGHDTVSVIDISGPTGPTWAKGRRSVRDGRGPRDTYG